jgi:hypothetical protein
VARALRTEWPTNPVSGLSERALTRLTVAGAAGRAASDAAGADAAGQGEAGEVNPDEVVPAGRAVAAAGAFGARSSSP